MASSSSSSSYCLHHQWNDDGFHIFRGEDTRNNVISRLVAACLHPKWNCDNDVFVNFRGDDTRDNIISHLHDALCQQSVKAFIDEGLERGVEVLPALLNKIERSLISITVFSKDYASSPSCLLELDKILECREMKGQIVIPLFYRVEPSHVRRQTGIFGDAFVKHSKDPKADPQVMAAEVEKWKSRLTEASYLSGWVSMNVRPDAKLVEEIVKDILKKLVLISISMADKLVSHFDMVCDKLDSNADAFWNKADLRQLHVRIRDVHQLLQNARSYTFKQHQLLRLWFKILRSHVYDIDGLINGYEKSEITNRQFDQAVKRIDGELVCFLNSFQNLFTNQHNGERSAISQTLLLKSPSLLPLNAPVFSLAPTATAIKDPYNLSGCSNAQSLLRQPSLATTSRTFSFGKAPADNHPYSLNLSNCSSRIKANSNVILWKKNEIVAYGNMRATWFNRAGINEILFAKEDKKMTLIGDIDVVSLVTELRKLCSTDLVYFGPAKEHEEEGERNRKEPKKADKMKKKKDAADVVQSKSKKLADFFSFDK